MRMCSVQELYFSLVLFYCYFQCFILVRHQVILFNDWWVIFRDRWSSFLCRGNISSKILSERKTWVCERDLWSREYWNSNFYFCCTSYCNTNWLVDDCKIIFNFTTYFRTIKLCFW